MIGYVCKYAPIELLHALGADPVRIEPLAVSFDAADACMHPNVCSFAKAVLEEMETGSYEGIVLTSCCDSMRRLYDALVDRFPEKFVYILDLPRHTDREACSLYAGQIRALARAYQEFSGAEFNRGCLIELFADGLRTPGQLRANGRPGQLSVGIIGARYNAAVGKLVEQCGMSVAFDLTCVGQNRDLSAAFGDGDVASELPELNDNELIEVYSEALLGQIPCMRMADISRREAFLKKALPQVDGVIYHTVKFCDMYAYEFASLRKLTDVPMLKIETDALRQSAGQVRTRVEAFAESLREEKGLMPAPSLIHRKGTAVYVLGIDSGSTSTNAVVIDGEQNIVSSLVIRTGARSIDSAHRACEEVLEQAGLKREDIAKLVATGYGRVSVDFADADITEITCHARGAHYFNPSVRTILDIGGQDSKAIRLNADGTVADFAMNDKCAAGTGRFLEAMARTLEVGIDELGPLSQQSTNKVQITSMCTVFAESEVISLIADNVDKADIAAGVHRAIAGKAYGLMHRVGLEPVYMMTGGVAKNPGVVAAVEERLGATLYICPEPEIVGAVGATLLGLDSLA